MGASATRNKVKPDVRFRAFPKPFWALVKLVSEELGYSARGKRGTPAALKVYTTDDVRVAITARHLDERALESLGWIDLLAEYSIFRAETISNVVRPQLMSLGEARELYETVRSRKATWDCHLPQNKQKDDKAHPNYLGCLVNMLAELELGVASFVSNPGALVTVTKSDLPVRTLARRVDGAFPTLNNPHAVWEVKEYYGTKTFGSRVSGGVYESMLDGAELLELREVERVDIQHYLFIDDEFTWWTKGRSYLCRLIDILHDGLVDEIFVGREVATAWPEAVRGWPR